MLSNYIPVLLGSLAGTSLGLFKSRYLYSLGYVSALGLGTLMELILFRNSLTPGVVILGFVIIGQCLRLGTFLFYREYYNKSFRTKMNNEYVSINFTTRIISWIMLAIIYSFQITPLLFRLESGKKDNGFLYIGIIIALMGTIIEATGDIQKSNYKKTNMDRFCDVGIYKYIRYPNYLGEMLFWTGNYISGLSTYHGFLQYMVSFFGYFCIILTMFEALKRMQKKHEKVYGDNKEFKEYVLKTSLLIPLPNKSSNIKKEE
ncbi:hypothetical protein BCR32DRAFT_299191 [Anaeromyces robustus]|uniref:Uncharacterized protein n=1 Tax=Anaeromyces robustus TaxID=1754192 RepID=A0A1Y1XNC0_9FUNG|nr:hypothetical protein BCR32DRAFT_299191 [Anaeromyces robustus]|eukprot:ORX87223.1 hypothetical protein BCR32DRAFT_299191 [Anaeromyces robustus]